jgi:microcystin-dependent protein
VDRQIVYGGAIPLEVDLLNTNKFAMVGLSKLAGAILGTSNIVNGLACAATSPASMSVSISPGEIYSLQNIDGSAYSSLSADTTHQIVKQGILLDAVTLSCPAPTTNGYSINYLVEAAYQDLDSESTLLPYYNASNPEQSYSGPNNSGQSQNTARKGICAIQVKAGIAAASGNQLTPAADVGYTGLWVITVSSTTTGISSANISQLDGAPFISETLTQKISKATADGIYTTPAQVEQLIQQYAVQAVQLSGSGNAFTGSLVPAITSNTSLGEPVTVYFPAAITGAATINLGGGATALVDAQGNAFSATNTVPSGASIVQYNTSLSKFQVLGLGGIDQVARNAAAAAQNAVDNFQGEFTGTIKMWPTATAPNGYLSCAGAAVSRATYAALFAVIGTTFGAGDGSTTFNLPNYVDRMPIGAGTIAALAVTGGSKEATLVSHSHSVNDPGHSHGVYDPGHAHNSYGSGAFNGGGAGGALGIPGTGNGAYPTQPATTGIGIYSAGTGISIASAGASAENANLPPYLGINFIIKT